MNGSTAGNPDHTFLKTSQPKTAPGKQTLHSLKIKKRSNYVKGGGGSDMSKKCNYET